VAERKKILERMLDVEDKESPLSDEQVIAALDKLDEVHHVSHGWRTMQRRLQAMKSSLYVIGPLSATPAEKQRAELRIARLQAKVDEQETMSDEYLAQVMDKDSAEEMLIVDKAERVKAKAAEATQEGAERVAMSDAHRQNLRDEKLEHQATFLGKAETKLVTMGTHDLYKVGTVAVGGILTGSKVYTEWKANRDIKAAEAKIAKGTAGLDKKVDNVRSIAAEAADMIAAIEPQLPEGWQGPTPSPTCTRHRGTIRTALNELSKRATTGKNTERSVRALGEQIAKSARLWVDAAKRARDAKAAK
jgi:hypothetical protein